jgi:dihydrofolate synthase/folylpolyglutamate synthase
MMAASDGLGNPHGPLLLASPAPAGGTVCIDGRPPSPDELIALVDEVRGVVERLDVDDPHLRHRGSTFFEITTAMGLLHFARRKAQVVVLEVGLGGRLDSTNVVHPASA